MSEKEEARKQFELLTKQLNLKHYFSFDEAWDYMTQKRASPELLVKSLPHKEDFRASLMKFHDTMLAIPDAAIIGEAVSQANPVKHTFIGGCYIREIYNPKGEFIVTKIHKVAHPFFLLKGDMSILTERGPERIKAPYWGITPIGTKRIILTHEECVFVTVHATKQTNIEAAEKELVAEDYSEINDIEKSAYIDILATAKEN